MAITKDQAEKYKDELAVLALRSIEDTEITEDLIEDPTKLDNLVDLGLLEIPENTLTIQQALGSRLNGLTEGLTAITPDLVGEKVEKETNIEIDKVEEEEVIEEEASGQISDIEYSFEDDENFVSFGDSDFVLSIEEGKDIRIEFSF